MEDPRPEGPADAASPAAPESPGDAPVVEPVAAAPTPFDPPSTPPPETGIGWLPAARLDVPMAVLLGVLFLGALTPFLGVWEPWEAQQAAFAASLREAGAWLVAELPKGDAKSAVGRFELPYGWWPVRVSLKVFGDTELGLRLPGLLASLGVLAVLMATVKALWGRLAGWFAVLALLSMPLFAFHGRQNFGQSLATAALAIGALCLIRRAADAQAGPAIAWLGWLSTAVSALTGAVGGLAVPLAAGLGAALVAPDDAASRRDALRRLFAPAPAAVAVVLIAVGWGAAFAALPEDARALSLLYVDPHEALSGSASPPSFERFTHQIGFGLFPLGALLPLALGLGLWGLTETARANERGGDAGLALGFAVAFVVPALFVPLAGGALFAGAALVAAAIGVYLVRALRGPPSPVLALVGVMMLMLLDSNLKHEPRALADTLLGVKVDQFPPELSGWSLRRVVSAALMVVLVLFQGGLAAWIARTARFVLYPRRRLGWLHPLPAVIGGGAGLGLWAARTDAVLTLVNQKAWPAISVPWRNFVVLATFGLVVALVFRALFNLWVRRLDGRTDGRLGRFADRLEGILARPAAASLTLATTLAIAAAFMTIPVALALTANFSQKNIVQKFEGLADNGEALFKYRVDAKTASFYTRSLPELTPAQFKEKAKADERFFAVVPRPQLAAINSEFRAAAEGKTLPVLDASSYRFLLISNRLEDGETDENPITQALLKELPKEKIRPAKFNFDDQIELAGWYIDPPEPKTGSRITITLYWRVLKKVTRTWKIFMHIDAPGARVHGDHEPVEGLYPTNNWNAGDIVKDVHSVPFAMSNPAGRYTVWAGLYSGSTRAPVKSGDKDNENRAKLGTINVR